MSLSTDPNDSVPIVLRADQGKHDRAKADGGTPPEPRTFRVRFHTAREAAALRKLLKQAEDASEKGDDDSAIEALDKLIAAGASRWDRVVDRAGNVVDPTRPASQVVTDAQLWELAYATLSRPRASEEDLRNFVPPSAGSGGSSANATLPAAASA